MLSKISNTNTIGGERMKKGKKEKMATFIGGIEPHIEKIGRSIKEISKILKLKEKWYMVDMAYKKEGKGFYIDEFRLRSFGGDDK